MRWLPLALVVALPAVARPYVRTTTQSGGVPCPGVAHPLAWPTFPVPYVVDAAGSADIPGTSAFEAVDASFATWAAPACTGIRFRADGMVANVPIGFSLGGSNVNAVKWIESGWTQSTQAIAVTLTTFYCDTGEIVDADVTLNGQGFAFATAPGSGPAAADVQNTVTHEVGHVLGFDHAPDPESTMYADSALGETKKRDLTSDDLAGACDVYPAGGPPPPAPAPAPPHGGGGCSSGGAAPPWAWLALAAWAATRRRPGRPQHLPRPAMVPRPPT
ncbi:MAG TPA: matrixin family metalloprotease [Anaeromyxobacteraceae bacterium]|nr:matrixin family metalloprotease [Anaeromyxobacteraceae bacterium]